MKKVLIIVFLVLIVLGGGYLGVRYWPMEDKNTPISTLPPSEPAETVLRAPGFTDTDKDTVRIDAPENGIVRKILVEPDEDVKRNQPLFQLDDTQARHEALIKKAQLDTAKANREIAESELNGKKNLHKRSKKDKYQRDEIDELQNQVETAEARVKLSDSQVQSAETEYQAALTHLQKLTVTAPIQGKILQVNIKVGEYFNNNPLSEPPIRIGNSDLIFLRVNIDENSAAHFSPKAQAFALINEDKKTIEAPLTFVRVEPYFTSKTQFTQKRDEHQYVRVMQIIYSLKRNRDFKIYSGQNIEVKILLDAGDHGRKKINSA